MLASCDFSHSCRKNCLSFRPANADIHESIGSESYQKSGDNLLAHGAIERIQFLGSVEFDQSQSVGRVKKDIVRVDGRVRRSTRALRHLDNQLQLETCFFNHIEP